MADLNYPNETPGKHDVGSFMRAGVDAVTGRYLREDQLVIDEGGRLRERGDYRPVDADSYKRDWLVRSEDDLPDVPERYW